MAARGSLYTREPRVFPHQCVFRWFSEYPGDCHTSVATLVRNDIRCVVVLASKPQTNQESAERLRIPPILGKGYKRGIRWEAILISAEPGRSRLR